MKAAFAAGADWQLACEEGARLRLTQDHGDGWANVELVEGAGGSGAVPIAYLEVVGPPTR